MRAAVLALLLLGCGASLHAIIAQAVAIADSAITWIDRISDFVAAQPLDPATRADVTDAIAKTRAAAEALDSVAQNVDATATQIEEARIRLRAAYEALLALTRTSGVNPSTREQRARMSAAPGVLAVPTVDELAPELP